MKRGAHKCALLSISVLFLSALTGHSQTSSGKVVITGARFTYPLVSSWIKAYKSVSRDVTVEIAPRSTTDPEKFDLLIEAYEPDSTLKETRELIYIGRYAVLPVANVKSQFAKVYGDKGLTREVISQVYFHDVFADKSKKPEVEYTVYTRLQKAGIPFTFARYFGYEQASIKGKAIAGADEHLIKALLKDSTGIAYSTLGLLYDLKSRKPVDGLAILPIDADDNKRISNDERVYQNLDLVISRLEASPAKNIPVEYLHISIGKNSNNAQALEFLRWVINHGGDSLHVFGFVAPEPHRFQKEKLKQLTLN